MSDRSDASDSSQRLLAAALCAAVAVPSPAASPAPRREDGGQEGHVADDYLQPRRS